eukprot:TRINITY_DN12783_c0_g1_i1.p1 TRINITY_DN12783_c0_g1~~TRINITY_DN12783_c0_g1_i1.p1  ORF type:complete len:413 (-),score=94.88 TRINITY_DN12783_c0_g1_i1:69-1169(-)
MENRENPNLNQEMKHLIGIHPSELKISMNSEMDMNREVDFLSGNVSKSNVFFIDSNITLPQRIEKLYPYKRRMMVNSITNHHIHFVDESIKNDLHEKKTILFLHGNGTWSFTWRNVIKNLKNSDKNLRLIAPDLLGFGLSSRINYKLHNLETHLNCILQLIMSLELVDIILVGYEWGSLLANLISSRLPNRIQGIINLNNMDVNPSLFQVSNSIVSKLYKKSAHIPILRMLMFHASKKPFEFFNQDSKDKLSSDEKEAYNYPFQSWEDRSAILGLAQMLPHKSNGTSKILEETSQWAQDYRGPFFILLPNKFSHPSYDSLIEKLRLCYPSAHLEFSHSNGQLIQEENPSAISLKIISLLQKKKSNL